ncbi:MAG: restriction endonuclease subunit S [Loktanella sp.]|nr:restriction endonuclease subunit S [Loktanella sp.]
MGKMLQPTATTELDRSIPYIRAANVQWGQVDWSDLKEMWFSPTDRKKYTLKDGDLVVLEGGDAGRCAILQDVPSKLGFQNSIHRVRARKGTELRFAYYWMAHLKSFGYLDLICSKATLAHFTGEKFAESPFPILDLSTQREIADFLDRETARIDLLIEKKQKLVDMVAPRFEALVHEARKTGVWQRFGFSAEAKPRPISKYEDAAYVPLGLYNRGRGFFKKPETAHEHLGDSSFFFVEKGDLVFSGQFAWEGAVGLVSKNEQGCVVSHRYPVYAGINGILSEYLFAYFRSHHGQFLMENCSRGAAGRNRPLSTRILEKEKIPIPTIALQEEVATLIEFERRLKDKTTPSIDRLKEYRSALITAVVTGQIGVTTCAKSGATDRRLDAIQEEMGA